MAVRVHNYAQIEAILGTKIYDNLLIGKSISEHSLDIQLQATNLRN